MQTEVWQMPEREAAIKKDMQQPDKLSESKAQTYANHFAHEEMGDMENFLQLLEAQARRSVLFADIDMDMVRKAIYNPVKGIYFDKNDDVKPEYVDVIINDYSQRLEVEAMMGEEMHLI